jgi:hypothetical protein
LESRLNVLASMCSQGVFEIERDVVHSPQEHRLEATSEVRDATKGEAAQAPHFCRQLVRFDVGLDLIVFHSPRVPVLYLE